MSSDRIFPELCFDRQVRSMLHSQDYNLSCRGGEQAGADIYIQSTGDRPAEVSQPETTKGIHRTPAGKSDPWNRAGLSLAHENPSGADSGVSRRADVTVGKIKRTQDNNLGALNSCSPPSPAMKRRGNDIPLQKLEGVSSAGDNRRWRHEQRIPHTQQTDLISRQVAAEDDTHSSNHNKQQTGWAADLQVFTSSSYLHYSPDKAQCHKTELLLCTLAEKRRA